MKKFVAMSAIAAMAVMGNAATDAEELAKLKEELSTLKETVKQIKIHDAGDNIKFSANLRTAVDALEYTRASGKKDTNANLMTNRLILKMSAQPAENLTFNGALSYNKAFGAASQNSANHNYPQRGMGFDTFDWVVNENLIDNAIRVKEASWFYYGDMGVPYTVSVGRRPATDGFLANYREAEAKGKSPNGHSINVEYDGASLMFKELTDFGTSFKICAGRGLTNARARFNMDGGYQATGGMISYGDYANDEVAIKSVDMYGLILVPYNDGQYKLSFMPFKATNLPGFSMVDVAFMADQLSGAPTGVANTGMLQFIDTDGDSTADSYTMNNTEGLAMQSMGDMSGMSLSFESQGVGPFGVSDFLDDTNFFVSWAQSTTMPNNEGTTVDMDAMNTMIGQIMQMMSVDQKTAMETAFTMIATPGDDNGDGQEETMPTRKTGMLGSTDNETGTSIWVGVNFPAMITDDGRLGIEYNQGSQYWRSMTYGEDTLVGSKLAVRGNATEVYYNQPIVNDNLKMQVRYTAINYTHTGSQGFFGDDGAAYEIDDAKAMGMDPVEKATDLRFSITYNY